MTDRMIPRIHQSIDAVCKEYGAHSSTYRSVVMFDSTELLPILPNIFNMELLPNYTLNTLLKDCNTKLKLSRYRRNSFMYTVKIWNKGFSNYAFVYKGITTHSIVSHILVQILSYNNSLYKKIIPIDESSISQDIATLLKTYSKQQLYDALREVDNKPTKIGDIPTLDLLAEVEARYKADLGDTWYKSLLPPAKDNVVSLPSKSA